MQIHFLPSCSLPLTSMNLLSCYSSLSISLFLLFLLHYSYHSGRPCQYRSIISISKPCFCCPLKVNTYSRQHLGGSMLLGKCCLAYVGMLHVYNLGQHVVNKLKEKVCFQATMLLKRHSHQMFLKFCPNLAYSDRPLAFWCTVIIKYNYCLKDCVYRNVSLVNSLMELILLFCDCYIIMQDIIN